MQVSVFLFYFRKQRYYACDELSPFVQNCMSRFEGLAPQIIAATLKTFLTQYGYPTDNHFYSCIIIHIDVHMIVHVP